MAIATRHHRSPLPLIRYSHQLRGTAPVQAKRARRVVVSASSIAKAVSLGRDAVSRAAAAVTWLLAAMVAVGAVIAPPARALGRLVFGRLAAVSLAWTSGASSLAVEPASRSWPGASAGVAYPSYRVRSAHFGRQSYLAAAIPLLATAAIILLALVVFTSSRAPLLGGLWKVEVPSLTGRSLAEAAEVARRSGLEVSVVNARPTADQPKDSVLSQLPTAGVELRQGSSVKLTVSAGLRPPSGLGMPFDEARTGLVREGWLVTPDPEWRVAADAEPGTVVGQRPAPDEVVAGRSPVTLILAMRNLAQGRAAVTDSGTVATAAVDGNDETVVTLGGAPGWLEIDFGEPVVVSSVRLMPAAAETGPAVIELWAWDVGGRFFPMHLFSQPLADREGLEARLPEPAANVTRLRVATTLAPGELGWREVVVSDR